jgi:hypothetical protein
MEFLTWFLTRGFREEDGEEPGVLRMGLENTGKIRRTTLCDGDAHPPPNHWRIRASLARAASGASAGRTPRTLAIRLPIGHHMPNASYSAATLGASTMGQISAKLIKRLGRSRKLTDELRRESDSIRAALDALKHRGTARSRCGEAVDPLHGVYAAVQNFSSVFAERVSVLPEFDPYYRVALDAQETYMPGGPPMSPLTGSYFTT